MRMVSHGKATSFSVFILSRQRISLERGINNEK
jgi:hypothetical protein